MPETPRRSKKPRNRDEEILQLVKTCKALIEENNRLTKKMKRHMTTMAIMSYIKIAIIMIPIILGFIYLPPLFKQVNEQYQQVLGIASGEPVKEALGNISPESLQDLLNSFR